MKPADKLLSRLDKRLERARGNLAAAARGIFEEDFSFLPAESRAALSLAFDRILRASGDARAREWLGGVAGLFMKDYDGTPFSIDEWREIGDCACVDQGAIDIELLSYVMTEVVEHGAI